MKFAFAAPDRIIFGPGRAREVGELAKPFGTRALTIADRDRTRVVSVLESLETAGISTVPFEVTHEPTTELVREGVERAREAGCDMVIGIGGGSVIDTGKAIAALLTNGGVPLDYLEVIGRGQPITKRAAALHCYPYHGGHRGGGDGERRAGVSGASRQSKSAWSPNPAACGPG